MNWWCKYWGVLALELSLSLINQLQNKIASRTAGFNMFQPLPTGNHARLIIDYPQKKSTCTNPQSQLPSQLMLYQHPQRFHTRNLVHRKQLSGCALQCLSPSALKAWLLWWVPLLRQNEPNPMVIGFPSQPPWFYEWFLLQQTLFIYLWQTNLDMENPPFIAGWPIKTSDFSLPG